MELSLIREAYKKIKLIREFEDYVEESSKNNTGPLMGLLHTHSGAEAWVTAVMQCITLEDYVSSTYRNHAHSIARGIDLKKFAAEISGKITGVCRGMAGNMHAVDQDLNMIAGFGIIGAGLPSACGAALASKMKKKKNISVVFFGDGAMTQGATLESFNMARVFNLPVLFCNDNNYIAMSTNSKNNLWTQSTAEYMKGFNIPAVAVDGMDYFESYRITKEIVEHMREGKGPYFIEYKNARFGGQWVGDPVNYKSEKQKKEEFLQCPVKRFERDVVEKNLLSKGDLKEIGLWAKKEVISAIRFAEESDYPSKDVMFENIYADKY